MTTRVCLVVQYYRCKPLEGVYDEQYCTARQCEIDASLRANLAAPEIDEVHLLTEEYHDFHALLSEQSTNTMGKVRQHVLGKRMTFRDAFAYCFASKELRESACIISNADIYFTSTLAIVRDIRWKGIVLAPTRFEEVIRRSDHPPDRLASSHILIPYGMDCDLTTANPWLRCGEPAVFAQDCWIFRPAAVPELGTAAFLRRVDFPLGKVGCDNVLARELVDAKVRVVNACFHIVCVHHDNMSCEPGSVPGAYLAKGATSRRRETRLGTFADYRFLAPTCFLPERIIPSNQNDISSNHRSVSKAAVSGAAQPRPPTNMKISPGCPPGAWKQVLWWPPADTAPRPVRVPSCQLSAWTDAPGTPRGRSPHCLGHLAPEDLCAHLVRVARQPAYSRSSRDTLVDPCARCRIGPAAGGSPESCYLFSLFAAPPGGPTRCKWVLFANLFRTRLLRYCDIGFAFPHTDQSRQHIRVTAVQLRTRRDHGSLANDAGGWTDEPVCPVAPVYSDAQGSQLRVYFTEAAARVCELQVCVFYSSAQQQPPSLEKDTVTQQHKQHQQQNPGPPQTTTTSTFPAAFISLQLYADPEPPARLPACIHRFSLLALCSIRPSLSAIMQRIVDSRDFAHEATKLRQQHRHLFAPVGHDPANTVLTTQAVESYEEQPSVQAWFEKSADARAFAARVRAHQLSALRESPMFASRSLRGGILRRPGVSLVTCIMNRTHNLWAYLDTWILQPGAIEIIVVDWGSEDEQAVISAMQHFAKKVSQQQPESDFKIVLVRVENERHFYRTAAQNLGARMAVGTDIMKIDSDITLGHNFFLKNSLRSEAEATAAAAGSVAAAKQNSSSSRLGTLLVSPARGAAKKGARCDRCNRCERSSAVFRVGDWSIARDANEKFTHGNMLVSAEAFFAVHGYDERIETYGWDDSDMTQRLQMAGYEKQLFNLDDMYHNPHSDNMRTRNLNLQELQFDASKPEVLTETHRELLSAAPPWGPAYTATEFELSADTQSGRALNQNACARFLHFRARRMTTSRDSVMHAFPVAAVQAAQRTAALRVASWESSSQHVSSASASAPAT